MAEPARDHLSGDFLLGQQGLPHERRGPQSLARPGPLHAQRPGHHRAVVLPPPLPGIARLAPGAGRQAEPHGELAVRAAHRDLQANATVHPVQKSPGPRGVVWPLRRPAQMGMEAGSRRATAVIIEQKPVHGDKLVFRYDDGSGRFDPKAGRHPCGGRIRRGGPHRQPLAD